MNYSQDTTVWSAEISIFTDGLIDCEDPECCSSQTCLNKQHCASLPEPMALRSNSFSTSFWKRVNFLIGPTGVQKYSQISHYNKRYDFLAFRHKLWCFQAYPMVALYKVAKYRPCYDNISFFSFSCIAIIIYPFKNRNLKSPTQSKSYKSCVPCKSQCSWHLHYWIYWDMGKARQRHNTFEKEKSRNKICV